MDLALDLMDLAQDDRLRRALAKLQAKVAAREKALAGMPVKPVKPRAGLPQPSGPIDWRAEMRTFFRHFNSRDVSAMEAHARGLIRRAPKIFFGYFWLCQAQMRMEIYDVAYETIKKAMVLYRSGPQELKSRQREYYCYRALIGVLDNLGEFEKALEASDRSKALADGDPDWWTLRAILEFKVGDPAASLATAKRGIQRARKTGNKLNVVSSLRLIGDASRVLGKHQQAIEAYGELVRSSRPVSQDLGHIGLAKVAALMPGRKRDLRAGFRELSQVRVRRLPVYKTVRAMLLSLSGEHEQALQQYERNRLYWRQRDSQANWYHGLSLLALNFRERAIERVTLAARRDPAYRRLLDTESWVWPIAAAVKRRLEDFARGKNVEERLEVATEQVTTVVLLAQIRGFVRTFRFKRALANLKQLTGAVRGSSRRDTQVQQQRVERYQALKQLLIDGIRRGPLKHYKLPLAGAKAVGARLSGADDNHYHLALPRGGSAKGLWAQLSFGALWKLFDVLKLSAAQQLALADLAWDSDDSKLAERSLARAWVSKGDRGAIAKLISRRRGVAVPEGGWVLQGGRFITAGEKRNVDKGLVFFRGRWVSKSDKRHLLANHEKIGGKWIALTAAQLRERGYIQYQGRWQTAKEIAQRRGDWKEAWTERTAHYVIKTNLSKRFARKLAVAIEQAYVLYQQVFGGKPKGTEPMRLMAFRTYEDYRSYCEKTGNLAQLNATGFSPSEPRTACGYDKLKDERSLLQTMLHEGAHLFYQLSFGGQPESWLAEGMATYFEGFKQRGKDRIEFHHKPRMRRTLFRQALSQGQHIPLKDFFGADAGKLINSNAKRALVFYAQAWALHYFLRTTPNPHYRVGFKRYWVLVARGNKPNLLKVLSIPVEQLERDFLAFIKAR